MNIVYCVTGNYIDKIKPSIRSLREHNDCDIYLITEADTCDIPDVKVIDIRGQQIFTKDNCVNFCNQFTYIGLLKVCYQSLLPVGKVIHLDADTIVTDSLQDLWDIDLTGKWYAMTQEFKGRYKPFGQRYYNAGVMVANLQQLRLDGIETLMVEYLRKVKQPWCEQDAFNKYGLEQDKIVDFPVRFNENQMTGETDDPAIVHYVAIGNWWDGNCYRGEYLKKYKL